MTSAAPATARWRDLLSGPSGRVSAVLAGGVAVYAITVYLTGALLPSLARELDGGALYAWVNTAFLTASIAASAGSGSLARRFGLRAIYPAAFALFAIGALLVGVAPSMGVVVAGRAVQGLGGGLLSALAYVSINALLPAPLWGRAAALVTAMWGIGGIAGPAIGGMFGEAAAWRTAFAGLAAVALVLGALAVLVIRPAARRAGAAPGIAIGSLVAIVAAVVALSVAAIVDGAPRAALVAAGVLLLVGFGLLERSARAPLLPRSTFRGGSALPWIYVLVGVLAGAVMIEAFVPLFAQQLGGWTPLAAGYLGAVPSIGWTVAQFLSAGAERAATRTRLRRIGPAVTIAGLAGLAAIGGTLDGLAVVGWLLALLAVGVGVGLAFPHLIVAAMTSVDDPDESARASAGISTVQLLSNALFSALCGLLLALPASELSDAQTMAAGVLAIVTLGTIAAAAGFVRRR